jgi:hypothetical protein
MQFLSKGISKMSNIKTIVAIMVCLLIAGFFINFQNIIIRNDLTKMELRADNLENEIEEIKSLCTL